MRRRNARSDLEALRPYFRKGDTTVVSTGGTDLADLYFLLTSSNAKAPNSKLMSGDGTLDIDGALTVTTLDGDTVPEKIGAITYEPTGFVDRTSSTISFVDGTRVFTLAPVSGTYTYYYRGTAYSAGTKTVTVANTNGLHFIYIAANGTLTESASPWGFSDEKVFVATLYWNGTTGLIGDERHGLVMDWATHDWMHHTIGVRYRSGLTGTFTDPTAISVTSGLLYDEDIELTIDAATQCRVLWRDTALGAGIFNYTAAQNSYRHMVSAVIQYDNSGTLSDVTNNSYVAYWIFGSNDPTTPIYALMGQREDTTLANARENNKYESLSLGTLPLAEMKILYRVILRRTSGSPGGEYIEAQDLRSISNIPAGTYVATSHGALTGLLNDDHTQYLHIDTAAGAGLTISSRALAVGAGDGIDVAAGSIAVDVTDILGSGLTESSNNIDLNWGTPTISTIQPDDAAAAGSSTNPARSDHKHAIACAAATTLTASSTNTEGAGNDFARATHTHAITSSSNPGAAASILASSASGYLQLVRLGIATAPSYPLHVIGEARIDGDLTFVGAQSITTTTDNLTLAPAGDITINPTGNDVLPYTNYDINLGSLAKKYLTLHAAELWVETLVAQNTIATIGGRILVGPTTKLTSDLASGDTTIYVEHNQMASGDRVYLEADGKIEFMAITSAAGGAGPYSYSVTRNLDGSGANTWYAGDAVFNTGAAGDGFIDIYSVSGVKASTQYGPTIVGNVRNGTTYNDWTEAWAIGNLNGLYGYSTDIYGAGLGKYSAADYITIDPTNGIRFLDASDVVQAQLSSSVWTLGRVAVSYSNVRIASGALQLRTNETVNAELTAAGELILGDDGGAQDWISISSANGIRLYGNNTLLGQWTTAGKVIVGQVANSTSRVEVDAGAINLITRSGAGADATNIILSAAGVILVGQADAGQNNILISAGAISIRNNETERIGITAAGILTIKDSGGNAVLTFDASTGAEITKKLTMPGANSAIAIGTTPPTSASAGTGVWIDRTGLYGLSSGTYQVKIDATTGALVAGGGKVRLDASGLALERGANVYNKITWTTSSFATTQATIYNFLTGTSSELVLNCVAPASEFGGVRIETGDGGVAGPDAFFYNGGVLLGENSNYIVSIAYGGSSKLTRGLVIDQGVNTDEIVAFQSSNVNHGITDRADTDTFGTISRTVDASGGMSITGYTASEQALALIGRGTNDNTTKTTSAAGYIVMVSQKKSSATVRNCGSDANLLVIRNHATARFIFDAEGSAHADVEWTTFDAHDDVALLNNLETTMLAESFGGFVDQHRNELQRLGIAHFDERPGHAMVNFTRLSMLHTGAIRQLYARIMEQDNEITALKRALTG